VAAENLLHGVLSRSAAPCALTVLHAHKRRRLTKTFTVASNGVVVKKDYDNALHFAAERVPLHGILDLHARLQRIESDPHACIIRGEAKPDTDLAWIRRKKAENGGIFQEVPRRWVMLDIDGVPLPAGTSVLNGDKAGSSSRSTTPSARRSSATRQR
jgi:hypothetical protein